MKVNVLRLAACITVLCVVSALPLQEHIDVVVRAKETPKANASTSPSASPSLNSTNSSSTSNSAAPCFPHFAQVRIGNPHKRSVRISELREGHIVEVGNGKTSPVYLITHAAKGVPYNFVQLITGAGPVLTLTAGHYVPVDGNLKAAGTIRVGDMLTLADGTKSPVASIGNVMSHGLYSVQTAHGDIVVDGVVASTYTTAADARLSHAALLPLRAAFSKFGLTAVWNNGLAEFARKSLPVSGASYAPF